MPQTGDFRTTGARRKKPNLKPGAFLPAQRCYEHRYPPALAAGVELLGKYDSPGMTDDRYLVRRGDGQIVMLTLALYLIAVGLHGRHSLKRIAQDVTVVMGQPVTADIVSQVIDAKLRPMGLLAERSTALVTIDYVPVTEREPEKPLLSLTMRGTLIPPRVVRALAWAFRPFFWPLAVPVMLVLLGIADYRLLWEHGVAQSFTAIQAEPVLVLPVFGILIASMIFHEIGHATACAYGGGKPGRVGYGFMIVFPALYTDVNDAYTLTRRARVRTDLGGVYFNGISIVALTLVWTRTEYLPLIPAIVFIHITMFQQMLPLIRLDGYYVLSDLVGVPDLYQHVGPVMKGLIPWKRNEHKHRLRPAARRVVAAWSLIVFPVLIVGLVLFLISLPRVVSDGWTNFDAYWLEANTTFEDGRWASFSVAIISIVLLALPALGAAAFTVRVLGRAPQLVRRRRRNKQTTTRELT